MRVAVIPARGGSKRIPRKNIRLFAGKPIISYSISAALESGCFDRVIVSTDDPEIASVAREWGAETPFVRPAELSDDHAGTTPVISHAVACLAEQGVAPTQICCLYATAPFVLRDDLRQGLALLEETGCEFVFSVTSYPFPIQRAIRINTAGRVEMFDPSQFAIRSQDLEEAFHDAGQFYWGRADSWLQGRPVFSSASVPLLLPRHRVQDIDTPEDWVRAEWMYKAMQSAI